MKPGRVPVLFSAHSEAGRRPPLPNREPGLAAFLYMSLQAECTAFQHHSGDR